MTMQAFGHIVATGLGILFGVASATQAQSGTLDMSFGGAGFVATGSGDVFDIAIQPSSNKIVAGGMERIGSATNGWLIVRFNPDGSLDSTFGASGKVNLFTGNSTAKVLALTLDSSERILASGYAMNSGGKWAFTVVRLNAADGSLDTSFGSTGIVQTRIGKGNDSDWSSAIAVDPNSGKVIVGGSTPGKKSKQLALIRYTPAGALDTSFDGDGIRIDDWTAEDDTVVRGGLAVQSDGKIIALRDRFTGIPNDWRVARYNSNGSNDSTFGTSGKINPTFSGQSNVRTWGVALQGDGRIVVSGRSITASGGQYHVLVARHNTNGSFDTSFDGDGWSVSENLVDNQAQRCAIQSDGKIVVAGNYPATNGVSDFVVTRFNVDGSLDSSFGSAGTSGFGGTGQSQLAGLIGSADLAFGIAIDINGRIVVGGPSQGSSFLLAVARYLQ